MIALRRFSPPLPLLALFLLALGLAAMLRAQIEGGDRGVPPIDSSSSFEVSGITVDVVAKGAEDARHAGWREAQRRGWKALWQRIHPGEPAPDLSDSALDGIVSGIAIEQEEIGPHRYIARLGVLFDRARAGAILGTTGQVAHSAPMLVIPIQWSAGVPQSFEVRTEWQKAWARFRTGGSAIDYVRPTGTGVDPLILNAAQTLRPGRTWWRMLLDGYGAADVVVPMVELRQLWPGGPVIGHFIAYHGPDRRQLGEFTLRVENSDAIPRLMDEGVKRIDAIYTDALNLGQLAPDPSLTVEPVAAPEENNDELGTEIPVESDTLSTGQPAAGVTPVSIQFDTPDVGSVSAAEAALRGIPGVRSAATSSLALGGVSVMRVQFQGDIAGLRAALQARGWQVQEGPGTLRIRRGGGSAPAAAASPSPAATAK